MSLAAKFELVAYYLQHEAISPEEGRLLLVHSDEWGLGDDDNSDKLVAEILTVLEKYAIPIKEEVVENELP